MSIDTLTHAVTVHQPLAWAIAARHCPIINSTTRPGLEHIGKLVGIHASGSYPYEHKLDDVEKRLGRLLERAEHDACQRRGALIGVAGLVGVVRVALNVSQDNAGRGVFCILQGASCGVALPAETQDRIRPWWRGPWGWLLEEAVLLPEPIPMRGAGGVWRIPDMDCDDHAEMRWIRASEWALEQWRKARGA